MQLSDLLARLSPDEHKILLARRNVPEHGPQNRQSLAASLAHPASVAAAFTNLNVAQFRVLEWLAMQPGLQATWSEFIDALGDRLSDDLRDAYLTDLRQLALVDWHPTVRGGFVATYPAAVSALPSTHRLPVRERLAAINSDILLRMCSAIGIRPAPTRKDQRIEAMLQIVSDTEQCGQLLARLSPAAQELFSWMLDRRGPVSAVEMEQRVTRPILRSSTFGYAWTIDSLWNATTKGELDPLTELMRCALVLPISAGPGGWYPPSAFVVPSEVRHATTGQGFFEGGLLMPPAIASAEGASGTIPSPTNISRDIGHLLGFIATGRCEWRQDGQPYKRSLVAFGKLIQNTDAGYVEDLWGLAVSAGLVMAAQPEPPNYALQYVATVVGKISPEQFMVRLLSGWLVQGEMTLNRGGVLFVRDNARMRMLLFVRIMPTDTWVLKSSIEEWFRFAWPLIFAPGLLGMPAEPVKPPWSSLGRLVVALGAAPDGQEAIMLPAAHQRLLDPQALTTVGDLPPWDDSWTIQPDRTIVAPPNVPPDAIADLWRLAVLESNQGAAVFRVTAASIATAINQGMTPDQIKATLTERSRTPLPPTVERLIQDQAARYGRIKVGRAETFVQVDDPALMTELRRHAKLKDLRWHDVTPGVAFVQGSDPATVLDTLRKAGYLPVGLGADGKPVTGVSGAEIAAGAPIPVRTIRRVTNAALRDEDDLAVTWTERGRVITEVVTPIDLHQHELHVLRGDGTAESDIPFEQIREIEAYVTDDDELDFDWDEEP